MTLSLGAACLWFIVANVAAIFPSRDHHWRLAYWLIAIGVPIVGWITWVNGPLIGLLVLAAGASILRWPVIYLGRWIRQRRIR